ncbi:hypothetical protein BJ508DRAFT_333074 [Ascobolus immersus RN42]|uniref:Uncharacterized protein n=1 Tax=Ascobolus immersus RN42 TaxID=1160509 RepID=A0A3N4HPK9_ASCIM|nr:hypothetical protein BJ508DRAFT_333074 [Ascobolus immersus RN42]
MSSMNSLTPAQRKIFGEIYSWPQLPNNEETVVKISSLLGMTHAETRKLFKPIWERESLPGGPAMRLARSTQMRQSMEQGGVGKRTFGNMTPSTSSTSSSVAKRPRFDSVSDPRSSPIPTRGGFLTPEPSLQSSSTYSGGPPIFDTPDPQSEPEPGSESFGAAYDCEVTKLQNRVKSLEGKLALSKREKKDANELADQLQVALTGLKDELKATKGELESKKESIDNLEAEILDHQSKQRNANSTITNLNRKVLEEASKASTAVKQSKKHAEKERKLEEEVRELKAAVEAEKQKLAQAAEAETQKLAQAIEAEKRKGAEAIEAEKRKVAEAVRRAVERERQLVDEDMRKLKEAAKVASDKVKDLGEENRKAVEMEKGKVSDSVRIAVQKEREEMQKEKEVIQKEKEVIQKEREGFQKALDDAAKDATARTRLACQKEQEAVARLASSERHQQAQNEIAAAIAEAVEEKERELAVAYAAAEKMTQEELDLVSHELEKTRNELKDLQGQIANGTAKLRKRRPRTRTVGAPYRKPFAVSERETTAVNNYTNQIVIGPGYVDPTVKKKTKKGEAPVPAFKGPIRIAYRLPAKRIGSRKPPGSYNYNSRTRGRRV